MIPEAIENSSKKSSLKLRIASKKSLLVKKAFHYSGNRIDLGSIITEASIWGNPGTPPPPAPKSANISEKTGVIFHWCIYIRRRNRGIYCPNLKMYIFIRFLKTAQNFFQNVPDFLLYVYIGRSL